MPPMHVTRKLTVNAPISQVHDSLIDMGQWKDWSPWLIMDPSATVKVKDDKSYYSWEGSRVGSGEMRIKDTNGTDQITYDLQFLSPWKSQADVGMYLHEVEGGTEVKWTLDSSLPWFLFWMKSQMEGYVGMDYERGLQLLKAHLETGEIPSKLDFKGVESYKGGKYMGRKRQAPISAMSETMKNDWEDLMAHAYKMPEAHPERAFTLMSKWQPHKDLMEYTIGVPVDSDSAPDGYMLAELPDMKVWTVEHHGPYEYLGNAWSAGHSAMRSKEFRSAKKLVPFETYANSPKDTDPKDLITRVHFPVR